MSLKEARVPDIGGYADVPVIEILVSPGDTVSKDQGLVTLESDKATMEVPAPFAGVVREIKVKLGDEVAEGSVVALIEEAASGTAEAAPAAAAKEEKAPAAAPLPPKQEAPAAPAAAPAAPDADSAGPRTPPVVFDANAVMPDKVPYATPAPSSATSGRSSPRTRGCSNTPRRPTTASCCTRAASAAPPTTVWAPATSMPR